MATRRGPRFKECRRFGINVCGHPKALDRLGTTVKRSKKMSEYGKQLLEKQKIKAYYGIFERQLLRYYKAASKSKARTADALFCTLECRLDNLVYRIGFANSIRLARQQVTHRHILVNGKNVNIPSYICKAGDVISLKENSRSNELFKSISWNVKALLCRISVRIKKASAVLWFVCLCGKRFLFRSKTSSL